MLLKLLQVHAEAVHTEHSALAADVNTSVPNEYSALPADVNTSVPFPQESLPHQEHANDQGLSKL